MLRRALVLAGAAAVLAGCVTAAHNVSVDDIRTLRLERVDVVLDPAAKIQWYNLQRDFAEARNRQGDSQAAWDNVAGTEAFRAQVRAQVLAKARAVVEPALRSALTGSTPVIARINVHHIHVPGFAEQMVTGLFLGAGAQQSSMSVSVDFIEARTNRPIVTFPRTPLATSGGQTLVSLGSGLFSSDPIERMLTPLNDRLPSWLLKTN
jgi:hypothetical protein